MVLRDVFEEEIRGRPGKIKLENPELEPGSSSQAEGHDIAPTERSGDMIVTGIVFQ